MKNGFTSAGMIYTLLVIFLILTFTMLSTMQNRKTLLDTLKEETVNALYCNQNSLNELRTKIKELEKIIEEKNKQITSINNIGDASESQILSGKKAYVKGKEIIGKMNNINGTMSAKDILVTSSLTKLQINTPGYYDSNDYLSVNNSLLASKIGLTASKLKQGETVLGITGTGSSVYKVYQFTSKEATISKSPYIYDGKWRTMSYEKASGCTGTWDSCNWNSIDSDFVVDLGVSPSQVISATVILATNTPNSGFRFRRGYASDGTTALYLYRDELMATIVNGNSYYDSGFETTTNKEKSDWHLTKISFKGDELTFSVMARRGLYTNGQTNSFYQTNGTKFYLSGVVVYK